MRCYRNLIGQISGCILSCRFCNLSQWTEYKKFKPNQKEKGQQIDHGHRNVYRQDQRMACLLQAFDRTMDQKIALHGKILGDRCHDSDYIFPKVSMIISGDKLIVSNLGRVEFQDLFRGFDSIQRGRSNQCAVCFDKTDQAERSFEKYEGR